MLISGNDNSSRLATCLESAHNFLLSRVDARAIMDELHAAIEEHWHAVCDEAQLGEVDKRLLWGRQFLNPYSFS